MIDVFKILEQKYESWKWEAETFFITKFIESGTIKDMFKNCLDIIFNITDTTESNRGIVAYNSAYGQGKTFFFDVANHRFRRKTGKNLFVRTSSKDLVNIFVKEGEEALLKFISCKNLFIDDIGDEGERKIFKHYSHEMNVIRYVILKRYEFWLDEEKEWKTYATTNLSKVQIAVQYDGRVADRLSQMCYWLDFKFLKDGKSFRQYDGTRKLTKKEVDEKWKMSESRTRVVQEKINVINYLNELILESDEYVELNDFTRWNFIKPYLVERNLVDLEAIDEELLNSVEMIAMNQKSKHARGTMKHAGEAMMSVKTKQARDSIKSKDVYYFAELLLVKKAFKKLRNEQYKFEQP